MELITVSQWLLTVCSPCVTVAIPQAHGVYDQYRVWIAPIIRQES